MKKKILKSETIPEFQAAIDSLPQDRKDYIDNLMQATTMRHMPLDTKMEHKFTIKKRRIEIRDEPKEVSILSTKKFVQFDNYRTVIGIYPETYDFTPNGAEAGIIYNCYIARNNGVQFIKIPDWNFRTLSDNDLKDGIRATLILIITEDRQYSTEIAEDSFINYYTATMDEACIPSHKVTFKSK